ncbi:MAG TPA: hypothetical protein VFM05_00270, partial [Candidatus Saccharimonadales bacterium]|nr:hypothetical protein [Candidatus Saccharimonadales bacterium]
RATAPEPIGEGGTPLVLPHHRAEPTLCGSSTYHLTVAYFCPWEILCSSGTELPIQKLKFQFLKDNFKMSEKRKYHLKK